MKKNPTVELKLPILKDMELVATHTSDVVAKHMNLSEEKSAEISMALIEACINAFEHSETKEDIYIHFIISDENLTIKVIDKGVGFDASAIELPNIDQKITDERKRGWGLMLIKELMDKVDYESDNTGTTLTMTKNKKTDE
ncbi:ATP-binding protein [Bacteroidetes bacterium SCGC AAA795-G10]|nr:ATP-binding protein [Bacteroidetes bacterium SCGC AAA795-G10]|tara:strand:- start:1101 stop:1523 length:423 start_codon:yes stop_codon:yes gene_type:complete